MTFVKKHAHQIPLLFLVLLAGVLRFVNLGYSDYQGDEIKALFLPEQGQSISEFLLTQRKGPVQFLLTYLLKFASPEYMDRFLVRFVFALAGVLAVYFFYKFTARWFSRRTAFYAGFFMATNGFFIAFSRIVQYQSFVILFMLLALYAFTLSVKEQKWRNLGVYLGFVFWAVSILAHYDGVFIAPFVAYILLLRFTAELRARKSIKDLAPLLLGGTIFVLVVGLFYVPFALNLDAATISYWEGRLEGTGGKISSSSYLFSVYQPIYVIHIYTALFALGVLGGILKVIRTRRPGLAVKFGFLGLWFLVPFVFLEAFVEIPGTHIYTYLVPAFIILGFGIAFITQLISWLFELVIFKKNQKLAGRLTTISVASAVSVVFLFISLQAYAVFVDHTKEYPWQNEKFYYWEFARPSPIFHLSMFGFPYYRNWDVISEFVESSIMEPPCIGEGECAPQEKIKFYSTNERESITRYHIPYPKDTNNAGYYVYINNPQSFTDEILNAKAEYWASKYPPVSQILRGGCHRRYLELGFPTVCEEAVQDVAIYYMPQGSLEEITALGY